MMRPCGKCFSDAWGFKCEDGLVEALCKICGNKVTFQARTKLYNERSEGAPCKCGGGKLTIKTLKFKQKKLSKAYYFTHALFINFSMVRA